jgi:toxin FitB
VAGFILDTDVLSTLRKVRKPPALQAWIERPDPNDLATTVITITEIQCGIERQRPSNAAYAGSLQAWLDQLLEIGALAIHPLDVKAAVLLGRMHETPALRNFVISDPRRKNPKTAADLAIAAIAIGQGAAIVTGNDAHFVMIDACFALPGLYNPFKGERVRPVAS